MAAVPPSAPRSLICVYTPSARTGYHNLLFGNILKIHEAPLKNFASRFPKPNPPLFRHPPLPTQTAPKVVEWMGGYPPTPSLKPPTVFPLPPSPSPFPPGSVNALPRPLPPPPLPPPLFAPFEHSRNTFRPLSTAPQPFAVNSPLTRPFARSLPEARRPHAARALSWEAHPDLCRPHRTPRMIFFHPTSPPTPYNTKPQHDSQGSTLGITRYPRP